jgi:hypothetical protein
MKLLGGGALPADQVPQFVATLYFYGPALAGYGFWEGRSAVDICAADAAMPSSFFVEHPDVCAERLRLKVYAFYIGAVWALVAALAAWVGGLVCVWVCVCSGRPRVVVDHQSAPQRPSSAPSLDWVSASRLRSSVSSAARRATKAVRRVRNAGVSSGSKTRASAASSSHSTCSVSSDASQLRSGTQGARHRRQNSPTGNRLSDTRMRAPH